MQKAQWRHGILLVALAGCTLLAACGDGKPSFKNTDLTGASYGRDFQLTDHTGRPRTLADFRGKVVTLFFGFTRCPDVCPTTLAEMRDVLGKLGEDAKRVQVIFVTVDPERDTEALLAKYITAFDPSFIGLRGDAAQTAAVAKEFKVFFEKRAGTTPDSYTIDHTAGTYVIDPHGRLRLFVRHAQNPDPLVSDLKLILAGK